MKKIDTTKGNKMIAEFMGFRKREGDNDHYIVPIELQEKHQAIHLSFKRLKYNESYDWVMPVVDKIENLGNCIQTKLQKDMSGNYIFRIIWYQHYDSQERRDYPSRIEAIYFAVIDFIVFYNNNMKK